MSVAHSCSSQNSEVPNALKPMEFCCWSFRIQMHKPLVQSSNRGKFAWTGQLYGFGWFTDSGQSKCHWLATTGWPPLVSTHGLKFWTKKKPASQIPNPTMRTSHVQCKKEWFLQIWPYVGEKENSPKETGWMEAWWMSFSWEYGRINWPWKKLLFRGLPLRPKVLLCPPPAARPWISVTDFNVRWHLATESCTPCWGSGVGGKKVGCL